MTKVKVIFASAGDEQVVEGSIGESVMRIAVRAGVPGIVGECGGELSCATCHVVVDEPWFSSLEPMREDEQEMLEAVDVEPRSRLGCQILLGEGLDGMRVDVPASPW